MLQSAGNLATTQEVLDRIAADLATASDPSESLATVGHLCEAALYVGRLNQDVAARHRAGLSAVGAGGTATFILGGQITGASGHPDGLPRGQLHPCLGVPPVPADRRDQVRPVHARAGHPGRRRPGAGDEDRDQLDGQRRPPNLSVGPPYDLAVYEPDSLRVDDHRIPEDSPLIEQLRTVWVKHVMEAMNELPSVTDSDHTVPIPDDLSVAATPSV